MLLFWRHRLSCQEAIRKRMGGTWEGVFLLDQGKRTQAPLCACKMLKQTAWRAALCTEDCLPVWESSLLFVDGTSWINRHGTVVEKHCFRVILAWACSSSRQTEPLFTSISLKSEFVSPHETALNKSTPLSRLTWRRGKYLQIPLRSHFWQISVRRGR